MQARIIGGGKMPQAYGMLTGNPIYFSPAGSLRTIPLSTATILMLRTWSERSGSIRR
ncbi:hypothetical protein NKI88_14930 [Mesorhizobium sp. M0317]|uniref:hypothetical protein n=1 Tax=Mesorhizobium sp. M0317 TaxID=2956935 RepID=UPI00333C5CE0